MDFPLGRAGVSEKAKTSMPMSDIPGSRWQALTYKKGTAHGILTEIDEELLQCHRLVVDTDKKMA